MTWTEEGTHFIVKAKSVLEQGPHYEGDAVTVIMDKKQFAAQVNTVGMLICAHKGLWVCV